jgi:hypothetical protein
MKASRQKATLLVLGVRMERGVNVTNANDLAKRISETKLFHSAVPARQPVLLKASLAGGDQLKYLWAIAREFQAYVKSNPPEGDYVLYADYLFNRQHWQQGGVHFVVCDRQGEWVIAELSNSDQEDYQRIKPISAEGCDTLVVERLARLMGVRPPGGQIQVQAASLEGHWEDDITGSGPAVSKELEGDWEGSLESPNGAFRLAFHFKNKPDKTVAATMDSNDKLGLPLNDVKQTGQKVEFAIKIAGDARFEGTLEGTELAGRLIHGAAGMPLMLRKKSGQPVEL